MAMSRARARGTGLSSAFWRLQATGHYYSYYAADLVVVGPNRYCQQPKGRPPVQQRQVRCVFGGGSGSGISRMLDMGGAPSALHSKNTSRINNTASKNCKVQAVAFDFNILTMSATKGQEEEEEEKENSHASVSSNNTADNDNHSSKNSFLGHVRPDTSIVQQVANLLKVDLMGERGGKKAHQDKSKDDGDGDGENDDLSLLSGENQKYKTTSGDKDNNDQTKNTNKSTLDFQVASDIRHKYANKLLAKRGSVGGVQGIDMARNQIQDALKKGDAASHLAARARAISQGGVAAASAAAGRSNQRWLAQTGAGKLLQYLTQRCIQICLLPLPSQTPLNALQQGQDMQDFERQLHHDVEFQVLIKDGSMGDAKVLIQQALDKLQEQQKQKQPSHSSLSLLDPGRVMLVSNRDDYLRAAKEAGMITCRLQPLNARRGNVSATYMVPSIPEVRTAIDDANGISFQAVLQGR